jgi:hypothetical protein
MSLPAGATIELDDRLYLAPSSLFPVVSYVHAVDTDARNVRVRLINDSS